MANSNTKRARPLSPHVMHYKPMLTMMLSILHRITGAALYFGTFFLALWLMAIADGPDSYDFLMSLTFASDVSVLKWLSYLALFGFTWALIHHLIGGIRHFIWDTGKGFDLGFIEGMAWVSAVMSISLTAAVWILAYAVTGGL